ncbi:MAG TPA: hypothetical protein VFD64_07515 [Gemmatimonadaceae bacterium]|nr:hypothetical protein [Gemmatimonadaceae bacterium]
MRLMLLSSRRIAVSGFAALTLAGCSLDVTDPSVVDASTIDPIADARVFSLSAQQNFYVAYASLINSTAVYSNETWSGAVRPETNDFGRHVVVDVNVDLSGSFWAPMQVVIGTNDKVVEVLRETPTFNTDINVARASLWSGLAIEHLAEIFCEGVLHVGPPLTQAQMLDSAIVRLQLAATIAGALTGAEATRILNTARVGLARAYLTKGDNQAAIAAAAQVPATFVASTVHVDDAQARARLSNGVYITSQGTTQIVAGLYRALGDPRVTFVDAGINAQDATNRLFRQTKYTSFTAPIRIASGLEARYISAEAQLEASGNTAPALALIAERRTAGSQPPFTGTTVAAVLAELMDQRARDFWLEARHLGDILRNPTAAALVPPAGSPFYKPALGNFLPIACLPIPFAEKANNPNFP